MCHFEVQYEDRFGFHAECIDAWDAESAVQEFRLFHRGQHVTVIDVFYIGSAVEEEAYA